MSNERYLEFAEGGIYEINGKIRAVQAGERIPLSEWNGERPILVPQMAPSMAFGTHGPECEPKPCPFCGAASVLETLDDDEGNDAEGVVCSNGACGANISVPVFSWTLDYGYASVRKPKEEIDELRKQARREALARWNKRPSGIG